MAHSPSPRSGSNGGTCKGCGGWTERIHTVICQECQREAEKAKKVECALPGCKTLFKRGAQARYCLVHRGLTSGEKRVIIRQLAAQV